MWGLNSSGYHLTNIAINTANVLLVFLVFYLLFQKINYAFIGSLFFSIHPCHVEAVSWISGRTDLLAALFLLTAAFFFILFLYKKKATIYLLTTFFFLLALLSKENSILFPLITLGLVFIIPYRTSLPFIDKEAAVKEVNLSKKWNFPHHKHTLLLTLPFWVLDFGYILIHNHFSGVQDVVQNFSFKDISVITRTIGAYTKIILTPFFPTPYFSMHHFDQNHLHYFLFFIFAMAILVFMWIYRDKYKFSLYTLLFLIFLLPVLDPEIVPSYPKIVIRFAYIPSVFAGIFFLDTVNFFKNRQLKNILIALLIFIGIIWSIETYLFQEYFKDQHHHYNDSTGLTSFYPEDCSLLLPLALMNAQQGNYNKALALVNQALEVNDQDPWLDVSEMGRLLKANLLIINGDRASGKTLAEKIIKETHKDEMKYFGYMILAKYHEKKGDLPEALEMLEKAESIGSTADLYFRKSLIYGKMGNYPLALRYIELAINLNPVQKKYKEFKKFLQSRSPGPAPK